MNMNPNLWDTNEATQALAGSLEDERQRLLGEQRQRRRAALATSIWIVGAIAILCLAAFTAKARAEDGTTLLLHAGSYHFDDSCDPNNDTFGIGVEHNGIAAGTFTNSYHLRSWYAGYHWRPIRSGSFSAGIFAALVTGYEKAPAMAGLSLTVEGERVGTTLLIMPPIGSTPAPVASVVLRIRM